MRPSEAASLLSPASGASKICHAYVRMSRLVQNGITTRVKAAVLKRGGRPAMKKARGKPPRTQSAVVSAAGQKTQERHGQQRQQQKEEHPEQTGTARQGGAEEMAERRQPLTELDFDCRFALHGTG